MNNFLFQVLWVRHCLVLSFLGNAAILIELWNTWWVMAHLIDLLWFVPPANLIMEWLWKKNLSTCVRIKFYFDSNHAVKLSPYLSKNGQKCHTMFITYVAHLLWNVFSKNQMCNCFFISAFRCCYCHYFNPARKQRPQAPRLSPISGTKSQPAGYQIANSTMKENNETSDSEKYSGSDSSDEGQWWCCLLILSGIYLQLTSC